MIEPCESFQDLPLHNLPFTVYAPTLLPAEQLTARFNDVRFPTVRYLVTYNGKTFRVKQFFMDWFFTGFPKSLFRNFSSTYSTVESFSVAGTSFYYGKNYRDNDSVSGYRSGTQIEIECSSGADLTEFRKVSEDVISSRFGSEAIASLQFPARSFFAKGRQGDWFEERRISRLAWHNTCNEKFSISGHNLRTSGIGIVEVRDKKQAIFILQEKNYENVVWAEISDRNMDLEHAYYFMRQGEGFYHKFENFRNGSILLREPYGPNILRIEENMTVFTFGFSPGFKPAETMEFIHSLKEFSAFLLSVENNVVQGRE